MERDPTARALTLLGLLQSGREWSGDELAARLGVSVRTVRRDAHRLRSLGYTVDSRPGPGSTYRLAPGAAVPPLLFEDEEITALVTGLRWLQARSPDDDAAGRALAKLMQVLPARLRRRGAATDLATEVLDGGFLDGSPGVAAATVGVVADAVAEEGRITFGYRDQHGRSSRRTVDPHRHVLRGDRWYLVGYDLDRADWRLFRFDRVSDVERLPGVHPRREFPEASVGRWFATDFGRQP